MVDNDWGNHHHGNHQRLLRAPGNVSPGWPKLDAIVVPERTPNISVRNWTVAMQMSQIAASAAFAAAYILK